jgi:quercetin dioxygenase-like cupin family protein
VESRPCDAQIAGDAVRAPHQFSKGKEEVVRRVIALCVLALALMGLSAGTTGATPGSGVSSQVIRVPAGGFDLVFQFLTVAPGGTTGWHSHPVTTTVFVITGAGTLYHSDCIGHTFGAGQTFTQPANEVHTFRNLGSVPVTVFATYVLPTGLPIRIDQPQPAGCTVT